MSNEIYDVSEIDGILGFVDRRLTKAEKEKLDKEGVFVYETRHDDNGDMGTPVTIENNVSVNFCNTIIAKKPLLQSGEDYITIDWDGEEVEEIDDIELIFKT